jgi:hypothetical protein
MDNIRIRLAHKSHIYIDKSLPAQLPNNSTFTTSHRINKIMTFKKTNLNPKGKKANDCVVRAIAYATGTSWQSVYQRLAGLGLEMLDMPNSKKVYERYLEKIGWIKHKMPKKLDGKRYTVKEFSNRVPFAIVSVAKHLTVIDGQNLIDTWDCSYKSVGNYWTK